MSHFIKIIWDFNEFSYYKDGVVNQPLGDPAQDELAGSGDGIGPDLNNEVCEFISYVYVWFS